MLKGVFSNYYRFSIICNLRCIQVGLVAIIGAETPVSIIDYGIKEFFEHIVRLLVARNTPNSHDMLVLRVVYSCNRLLRNCGLTSIFVCFYAYGLEKLSYSVSKSTYDQKIVPSQLICKILQR